MLAALLLLVLPVSGALTRTTLGRAPSVVPAVSPALSQTTLDPLSVSLLPSAVIPPSITPAASPLVVGAPSLVPVFEAFQQAKPLLGRRFLELRAAFDLKAPAFVAGQAGSVVPSLTPSGGKSENQGSPLVPQPPARKQGFFQSLKRIKALALGISDEELRRSLERMKPSVRRAPLRRWDLGEAWKKAAPSDFSASLSPAVLQGLFAKAVGDAGDARALQQSLAEDLHATAPGLAAFFGLTVEQRLIYAALHGQGAHSSAWMLEKLRHGPALEQLFGRTLTKTPASPDLSLAGRARAEGSAAAALLTLMAHAGAGTGSEQVLGAALGDDVSYYVMLQASRRWIQGQGRARRLWGMWRAAGADPVKLPALSARLQRLYALWTLEKRIDRFLKTVKAEEAAELLGVLRQPPVTRFPKEANPELGASDVSDPSLRVLKASDMRRLLQAYRKRLEDPKTWLALPGFTSQRRAAIMTVEGPVGSGGLRLIATFPVPGRGEIEVALSNGRHPVWQADLSDLSLRQLGALYSAGSLRVLRDLPRLRRELTPEELVQVLARGAAYKKDPLRVVRD